MRDVTIVFPRRSGEVLLGYKKRGFGHGKWNGFGGKVEEEHVKDAAIRELEEECGLRGSTDDLIAHGAIEFVLPDIEFRAHLFTLETFSGTIIETEEMAPQWYAESEIPFDTMWEDDRFWLPLVLSGAVLDARFVWTNDLLTDISIRRVDAEPRAGQF